MNFHQSIKDFGRVVENYNWESLEFYANYLAQTYYYVRQSTRLLSYAGSQFKLVDEALHKRFLKHTAEETSHEMLALRDLKKLGFKVEDFEEFWSTRSFYEVQFAKVQKGSPIAVYGYILALEGLAVESGQNLLNKVKNSFGEAASSFIRVHASEDPDHLAKAFDQVESMDKSKVVDVAHSFQQTVCLFSAILDDCANKSVIAKPA